MKYLLFAFCLLTIFSCSSDDDQSSEESVVLCTTEIVPSFRITVVDNEDNSLVDDVTVTVIENNFSEVLSAESIGVYTGPDERVGTYIITLEKEGFQTLTVTDAPSVALTPDLCHVDTVTLTYTITAM